MSEAENARIAREFIAGWEPVPYEKGCRAAYMNYLTEDVVYENSGLRPCTNHAEVMKLLDDIVYTSGVVSVSSEIRNIATNGDVVFTERIDNNLDGDGNIVCALPICGMMRFRDGKIAEWREYYHVGGLATGTGYLAAAAADGT